MTAATPKRDVGRPRTFTDDRVFLATAHALARLGYGRLTLAAVAAEVGCTRQALVRRFGSKHALIHAYLEWVIAGTAEGYRAIRAAHASPLAALRARFLLPVEARPHEVADPVGHGNILAFFIGARDDPDYRALLARLSAVYQEEVTNLLTEAHSAHELTPCDPATLAHILIVATTGELLLWAANPTDSPVTRIAHIFDAVVAPYLPKQNPLSRAPGEGAGRWG